MARTTEGYSQWFVLEVSRLARELDHACRATAGTEKFMVTYKPHGLEFSFIVIGQSLPEGHEPVPDMPVVTGAETQERLHFLLSDRLGRVPVLPEGK